jgi:hypothetical protein
MPNQGCHRGLVSTARDGIVSGNSAQSSPRYSSHVPSITARHVGGVYSIALPPGTTNFSALVAPNEGCLVYEGVG